MCWNGVIRYIHCNQLSLNFDITRKDVFVWGFIQNENILFWFTIFYPNCFCVLFSNIYPKIDFCGQNWSDLFNFYSHVCFYYKKICFTFHCYFLYYWCFTTILWNLQNIWINITCWRSAFNLPALPISAHITKTRLYNFDPLKPHFYTVKLRFIGVYIIFLMFAQKHRLWVLVRTASVRRS